MWGRGSLDGDQGIGARSLETRNKTVVYVMGAERASVVCCHALPNAEW